MAAGGTDPQPVDHLTGWPAEDKRNEERSLALKIVIVGNGKVGFSLAEQLVREKYDVVIVDMREDTLRRAADALDIMSVKGNGISAATLIEAGVPEADLLVAATNSDEINMVCCLTAKHLGAKYAIARIRNPEYNTGLSDLKRNMGIDMVINPENATAVEISRLLRFPPAANIETFCRGRVELIGFRLLEDDFLVNRPLHALSDQVKQLSLLFCAVERPGGEVAIPNGAFVPQAGDKLYLIGRPSSLDQFFRLLGRYSPKVKSVFIVGGGKISLYLSAVLEKMKMRVKIVEIQKERCRFISERLPHTTVICGDGTDQELLESERMTASDAFVALTDRDEDNLILSLYAMQKGVQKVVTKSNRQNYAGIAQTIGLDSVISPKMITAAQILQVVRGMQNSQGSVMNTLYRIADGSAEAMEFTASANTRNLGVPLKELRLRKGILIAVLARGGDIIIPEGSSSIQEGDSVILISRDLRILDLNDIYEDEAPSPSREEAMNIKLVLRLVGRVMAAESFTLFFPMAVALLYGESPTPFLLSILIILAVSLPLASMRAEKHFFLREGFVSVGLIWLVTGVVGGLPFYFSGYFESFVDCIFETCSGFTTTGATILVDIEALPRGILFWRSFTHWLGGMGVLVLATAILPSLGVPSTT